MSHHPDVGEQEIEEVAEELWTLEEESKDRLVDLARATQVGRLDPALVRLHERGLILREGDRIVLTASGRALAERQVRRHRLAEMLLSTALDVRDDQAVNRTACVMEHVLTPEVTDSVCAFLGHPKFCPHGKPIPPGECCRTFAGSVEPLVQPLGRLAVGQSGRIVYIVPRDADRMVRLSNLGIVPGATVRLQQKSPAAVLRIGETTIAVDAEIAGEIYVKRIR